MASVNLSTYAGSVVGTDWGPAWTAALLAIKTLGGTINVDVDNQIESRVSFGVSGLVPYCPIHLVNDGGFVTVIKVPSDIAFYPNGNCGHIAWEGLNFIGNVEASVGQPNYTSATAGIYLVDAAGSIFENCVFGGIACSTGVIETYSAGGPCPLVIRDSQINGCGGGTAIVFANGTELLHMENVEMYDYQYFRNVYYNKQGYPPYWIKAVYSGSITTSHVPTVHLKNVRTDEGAPFCYIEGYPKVIIEQCAANLGVGSQAIYLKNVEHAEITEFWAGYSASDVPAIRLENCGDVLVDGLKLHNGIKRIVADKSTRLTVRNSPDAVVERT